MYKPPPPFLIGFYHHHGMPATRLKPAARLNVQLAVEDIDSPEVIVRLPKDMSLQFYDPEDLTRLLKSYPDLLNAVMPIFLGRHEECDYDEWLRKSEDYRNEAAKRLREMSEYHREKELAYQLEIVKQNIDYLYKVVSELTNTYLPTKKTAVF